MSYDFSAYDVFEMAERIESNGANFYRKVSKIIVGKDNKDRLLDLANMEDKHKQLFTKMKKELSNGEKVSDVFDPEKEILSYLKALADLRVVFDDTINFSSIESILEGAIIAEKDSIVFYLEMKNLVPESKGKSKLDDIINEEMSHIRYLVSLMKSYKG